jgi:TolB-like protein/Tfp pilus assembly protein PilF
VSEFLDRLKQRKLVQWAVAYVAAAFALLQGLDIVAQQFGWPEGVRRGITIALAIGFFVTLVLAWYHGERGAQRVSGTELLFLALLLMIGGALLWRMTQNPRAAETTASGAVSSDAPSIPAKSIAVLPFTDLSPGHDQDYFSDGMAEEILNALAKLKDLKVAGRTSSFSFKGKNEDLRAIGKVLGVANILEGSVRKQGDKVRITAQLIRTDNDFHLWSETYDGDLSDVFALQERIARAITDKLAVALGGEMSKPLVAVATSNAEAYALYLQASGIFNRREGPRFPEAIAELEQALKLDPKFARAHARLAAIYSLEPIYVPDATESSRTAAAREAALASELDPTLAEPYAAVSNVYAGQSRFVDARAAMDRALALDPDDITANFWSGVQYIGEGYTARGCAQLDRVLAIDPLLPNALLWRGLGYLYSGDQARAETLFRRAADVGLAHVGVGMHLVEAVHGRKAEAIQQLAAGLRALSTGLPADAPGAVAAGVYGDAAAHAAALAVVDNVIAAQTGRLTGFVPYSLLLLGEAKRTLILLQQRQTNNEAFYLHIFWNPAERATRALPEFKAFTHSKGLVQLWDRYGPPDLCHRVVPGDYACD